MERTLELVLIMPRASPFHNIYVLSVGKHQRKLWRYIEVATVKNTLDVTFLGKVAAYIVADKPRSLMVVASALSDASYPLWRGSGDDGACCRT